MNGQEKIWGGSPLFLRLNYLQFLKLKYTLKDIRDIRGRMLDVGCGAGNLPKAVKFYRPDLAIFGCDQNLKAISFAQENPLGVSFRFGRAESLPFEDQFFEVVTMYDLLEHLIDPEKALREVRRVLKPQGLLILFAPLEGNPWTWYHLFYQLGWRGKLKHAGHVQRFDTKNLLKLLTKNRFRILKKRYSFHFLGQVLDLLYDLYFAGKITSGFEQFLEEANKPFLMMLKNGLVSLANLESLLLPWLPGGGVQLTCQKE